MTLSLIGDKNYLKRNSSSGTALIAAPATAAPWVGATAFYTPYTVTHNLGIIPKVRVYFENSATDTKLYPAGGRRLSGLYPGLPGNSIICLWEVTITTLTITLESNTAKTGNRNIYWVIYEDFEA